MPPDNWKETQMETATSHSSKKAGREHLWDLSNSEDVQQAAQARQG